MKKNLYHIIGLMSGSSLDGVDLAYCTFEKNIDGTWNYNIISSTNISFTQKWHLRLSNLTMQNAVTYLKTDAFLGHYLGELINKFIASFEINKQEIDFIASHGHTVFHQPENFMTSQIGDGAAIAAETRLPVICNFRTMDVALGGQGAPIVPIGDIHLFKDYRFCLNLGGIANITFKKNSQRIIAYDICACNSVLNYYAEQLGTPFDDKGEFAKKGELNPELLNELNDIWYYKKAYPKSLGGGWIQKVMYPLLQKYKINVYDKLRTVSEHIAIQIAKEIKDIYTLENATIEAGDKVLVTGGGAFNTFLIERLSENSVIPIVIPDEQTVKFKEALVMAFLGVLRATKEVNCLQSVTGAERSNIGGAIYLGS